MDIARLFDCPLCTGIPEREREQFIEGFDYSVKSYMKGEVVFWQGDVCRFLYILLEGEVEARYKESRRSGRRERLPRRSFLPRTIISR